MFLPVTLRQTVIPTDQLTRTVGAYRQIMYGSIPIGSEGQHSRGDGRPVPRSARSAWRCQPYPCSPAASVSFLMRRTQNGVPMMPAVAEPKLGPPSGSSAGDVTENFFVSAAVVHGTPTAAHVLGLIKKQPRTAGALLQA